MRFRQPQSQAGFTLVDVVMGAAILVVGFIAVVQAVTTGTVMLDTARKQQIAQQIIDAEIENLRASSWTYLNSTLPTSPAYESITVDNTGSSVTNNTTNAANYFILDTDAALLLQAKGFTCKLEVFNVAGRANIRRAVITVSWVTTTSSQTQNSKLDINSGSVTQLHTRSGETYLTRNGLQLSFQKS